jgi:hypothetical protein
MMRGEQQDMLDQDDDDDEYDQNNKHRLVGNRSVIPQGDNIDPSEYIFSGCDTRAQWEARMMWEPPDGPAFKLLGDPKPKGCGHFCLLMHKIISTEPQQIISW